MYQSFKNRREKLEKGSVDKMAIGQASPMGRYPSTPFQVRALLQHVEISGVVLDCCGSAQKAPATVLTAHGVDRAWTNDLNGSLVADSHMDAASAEFCEAYREEMRRPDWIVTRPPYKNAFEILKQALRIGRKGVAFKLRLTFLEPTKTRGWWLSRIPPDKMIVLPRATYRGRHCSSTEAWLVWHIGQANEKSPKASYLRRNVMTNRSC